MPTDEFDSLTGHAARHDALDAAVAAPTFVSATAPVDPAEGATWLDTSVTPNVLKVWVDGSPGEWVGAGGGGPSAAADVAYDNALSGLAATDVQDAIDELESRTIVIPDAQVVSALSNSFALKCDAGLYSPSATYFDVANETANALSAHSRAFRGGSGGKWYCEFAVSGTVGGGTTSVGVVRTGSVTSSQVGGSASGLQQSWGVLGDGRKASGTYTSYGTAYAGGDVIMVALDMTLAVGSRKIWFGKNGTWYDSGDPVAGTGEAFANVQTLVAPAASPSSAVITMRLRASDFTYSPPTGFSAWVT